MLFPCQLYDVENYFSMSEFNLLKLQLARELLNTLN